MDDCHNESIMKPVFSGQTNSEQNYYEVLEVPFDASKMQIREAYIRLKSTYSNGNQALYSLISDEDAQNTLNQLEDAYRVLYDDILRKDYDQNIAGSGTGKQASRRLVDPFHTAFTERESLLKENYSGSSGLTQENLWKGCATTSTKQPIETANKMRFAHHALENGIQEKIKSRLEQSDVDGTLIRDLREIQGVTLNELQDRTKVSLQYIIALENNDFQTLPSVVYVKGFLKICLQYLGVQKGVDKIINQYLESVRHWRESKGIEQY